MFEGIKRASSVQARMILTKINDGSDMQVQLVQLLAPGRARTCNPMIRSHTVVHEAKIVSAAAAPALWLLLGRAPADEDLTRSKLWNFLSQL